MSFLSDLSSSAPDSLPATVNERGLMLRNGLIGTATGRGMQEATYKALRMEFMADPNTCDLPPRFVRTCHDSGDFWEYIKAEFSTYAERRTHLRKAFAPLLAFLDRRGTPAAELISDVIVSYDDDGVHRAWQKALKRANDDPKARSRRLGRSWKAYAGTSWRMPATRRGRSEVRTYPSFTARWPRL